MKKFNDPKNIAGEVDEELFDVSSLIECKEDNLFNINSFEDDKKPAGTIYCKSCGGKEFNVGSGVYFTAIRCVTCEFEICIHDG